ncbi:MAG: antitoxin VapB family protein [Haloarculaceae archaeon]
MGSKNISVREDVYRALKNARGDDESFSDVIERLVIQAEGEHPLYRLVGTLDESDAERVRERAERFREEMDEGMDRQT